MSPEKRQELVDYIRDAFKDAPYPSRFPHIVKEFEGYTWEDVPLDVVVRHRDCLKCFLPDSFRYFFPAFLFTLILESDKVGELSDNVFHALTPPDAYPYITNEDRDWFNAMVLALSQREKCAISRFLNSYKELEPGGNWQSHFDHEYELEFAIDFWKNECSG